MTGVTCRMVSEHIRDSSLIETRGALPKRYTCLSCKLLIIFFNSPVKVHALVNQAYYLQHKGGRSNDNKNAFATATIVFRFSSEANGGAHRHAQKNKTTRLCY